MSSQRVEAEDLPDILAVGEDVFVKVTAVDDAAQKYSLSMKCCSQGDGRDLDPTHAEALADGDKRRPRGGGLDSTHGASLAALKVPEYGASTKQMGEGEYALVSDGEEEGGAPPHGAAVATAADGSYRLQPLSGGGPPPVADVGVTTAEQERQHLQVELAARLLAKAAAKKAKKESKRHKEGKRKKHKSKKKHSEKKEKKHSKSSKKRRRERDE